MVTYILTEGGKNKGMGHIVRCSALQQAMKTMDISSSMLINGDESVNPLMSNINGNRVDWITNFDTTLKLIGKEDTIIVDSYYTTQEQCAELSKMAKTVLFLDDYNRIQYPAGFVSNGNINPTSFEYKKIEGVTYLLGAEYIILREPFWQTQKYHINSDIENILITFGGNDIRNLTPSIIEILTKTNSKATKYIVIGSSYNDSTIDSIKQVADKNTKLVYNPNGEKMSNLMKISDVAISACGQTLNELARIGVPTIPITIIGNQVQQADAFAKSQFLRSVIKYQDIDLYKKVEEEMVALADQEERQKLSHIGKNLVDGQGVFRIIKELVYNEGHNKTSNKNIEDP